MQESYVKFWELVGASSEAALAYTTLLIKEILRLRVRFFQRKP